MTMKFRYRYIAAAILSLAVLRADALAAPIVFDVDGVFDGDYTLSGTMTIDTALGTVTEVDLMVGPPHSLTFSRLSGFGQVGAITFFDAFPATSAFGAPYLNLTLPVSTLVGYTGGAICSSANVITCGSVSLFVFRDVPFTAYVLESGSATAAPVTSTVPEPATLLLLGSGLLAITRRKWFR